MATHAEFVSKNFTKGQQVCIEGRLQCRLWTDKDNNNRYAYEIIADSVYFAGFKPNSQQNDSNDGFEPFDEVDVA